MSSIQPRAAESDSDRYQFKINSIVFNDRKSTSFSPSKINIIVGSNSSGKTSILREIRSALLGQNDYAFKFIKELNASLPTSLDQLDSSFKLSERIVQHSGNYFISDYCNSGLEPDEYQGARQKNSRISWSVEWREQLSNYIEQFSKQGNVSNLAISNNHTVKNNAIQQFMQFLGPAFASFSGTEDRLLLSYGEKKCGTTENERNALSDYFIKDPTLKQISPITLELFNRDVIIDPESKGSMYLLRAGDSFDGVRALTKDEANPLPLSQLGLPLYYEGDGIRSFLATMIVLHNATKPILLIDEPESSLHPTHAYKMGQILSSKLASMHPLQHAFIVTHSNQLLKGLLSFNTDDTSVIRAQRSLIGPQITILNNDLITQTLGRADYTPLEIDALFCQTTILVEAPQDALVFEKLAEKLGYKEEILFIPTGGKHSFATKCKWLKAASVNYGLISDFDILRNESEAKGVFRVFSGSKKKAKTLCSSSDSLRSFFLKKAEADNQHNNDEPPSNEGVLDHCRKYYKIAPLSLVPIDVSNSVMLSLDELNELGFLILTAGELESIFLPEIPHNHNSKQWLSSALDYIHSCSKEQLLQNSDIQRFNIFLTRLLGKVTF